MFREMFYYVYANAWILDAHDDRKHPIPYFQVAMYPPGGLN
jgi:hypothetical protein